MTATASTASTASATSATSTASAASRVDALDAAAVPVDRIDGVRPHELSGLAWDHRAGVLYAVSDRGVLFAWQLEVKDERIERFEPLWARRLAPAGGRINAEAVDLKHGDDGRAALIVADELGANAWSIDPATMASSAVAWPSQLAARAGSGASTQGIESLAWNARWGTIAALQRPRAEPRAEPRVNTGAGGAQAAPPHAIQAERAPHPWLLSRTAVPKSAIKAIEAGASGRVTVLEKAGGGTDTHRLRSFDPGACTPEGCADRAYDVPLLRNLPHPLNWEGLACRPDGLCVIASDDADVVGHGWIVLLRVPAD